MPSTVVACHNATVRQTPKFCDKYENFHYHGNRGRSGANLNDTIKLADFKKFGTRTPHIKLVNDKSSYSQFVFKYTNFRYHVNRGCPGTTLNWLTPKTPFSTRISDLPPIEMSYSQYGCYVKGLQLILVRAVLHFSALSNLTQIASDHH